MDDSLNNVIDFLKRVDELDAANNLLNVFSKYANSLIHFDILGRNFSEIKQYETAIHWTEKALVISPDNSTMQASRANLAKLYNHSNQPEKSLFYLDINQRFDPDNPEIDLERVFSLFLLNRKAESEAILREMLKREDLSEEIRNRVLFNLGTHDLDHGDFQKGLRGFLLVGKELGIWSKLILPGPHWQGGIQPGRELVIVAEGGIGDSVIFFRMDQILRDYGMKPIWFQPQEGLVPIFKRHGAQVIQNRSELNPESLWCYSMSLVIHLDLKEKDLWQGPYLEPDPVYVKKWNWIKHKNEGFKIGLNWKGNRNYEHDLHRSLDLKELLTVMPPNAKLFSLQKDSESDLMLELENQIDDLSISLKTLEDLMAAIWNLDLVVTSCTSIAHIASAMGKRTIVLVPISKYFVWMRKEKTEAGWTTPWYGDSTTFIEQTECRSWKEPMKQLKDSLINKR